MTSPFASLSVSTQMLVALNLRASDLGVPVFAGIPYAEKARRRAAGKRQRAARKAGR